MPRTITHTVYEKSDYDALEDMSIEEVIDQIDAVDDGYLGSSKYYGQDDYEGDECDYDLYKKHKALRKAMQMLREISKKEK